MKLSVIVPIYNEFETLREIVSRVEAVELPGVAKELILVDDCSRDGSKEILREFEGKHSVFYHERNLGKGAAVKTGIKHATGDVLIVQDADLEYNPAEYPQLLDPILKGQADVVFGSRFSGDYPHRVLYFWHYAGNKFLTLLSNILTNLNLTDIETGYKVFRREVLTALRLRENGFGFEPEVTAKVAKNKRWRIYEVGISYAGRTYEEGKKIRFSDGIKAVYYIFRYHFFD
ncbi:MAG: glycosyltransferase family 2 protein [Candidatus Doudnabacteria bacterium]|nr:glycosyltransferase family 2 protein [Candidatus Doudnabacteria bacterium]